jgi:hypothetical protein
LWVRLWVGNDLHASPIEKHRAHRSSDCESKSLAGFQRTDGVLGKSRGLVTVVA